MIVMPSNSTGWFWHVLARETGRLGHLFSPGAQRGPWPWFPYALDNGAFSCWDMATNTFDNEKWAQTEKAWRGLMYWARNATQQPIWAIVPDVPGNAGRTIGQWTQYAGLVVGQGFAPAVAVQDGMTVDDVKRLTPQPVVVCVGGTTEWKWSTVEMWKRHFARVHVLRVNSPDVLHRLELLGIESCDGTGWNRGDKRQTNGLEYWARDVGKMKPHNSFIASFTCREPRKKDKQKQTDWAWTFLND